MRLNTVIPPGLLAAGLLLVSCSTVLDPARPALVATTAADWSAFGDSVASPLPGARSVHVSDGDITHMDWSPDGCLLAVCARRGDRSFVVVVGADGERVAGPLDCGAVVSGGAAWLQEGDALVAATLGVVGFDGAEFSDPRPAVGVGLDPAVCRVSGRIVSVSPARGRTDRRPTRRRRTTLQSAAAADRWSLDVRGRGRR